MDNNREEFAEELFAQENTNVYQRGSGSSEPEAMQGFDFDAVFDDTPTEAVPVIPPAVDPDKPREENIDLDGKNTDTSRIQMKLDRKDRRRQAGSIISGILSWVKELAIAVIIVWFVITFVAQNNQVIGTSMQPTVYAKDMVIVNKFLYRFTEPERGDIVVFPAVENGEKVYLIKRIIGLPGDKVDIKEGKVYVNDKELEEDYIDVETTSISGQVAFPLTVPSGEYFVLGDNRLVSKDSRYLQIGFVPKSKIVGKASIRIWPFDSIGFIR